MTETSRRTLLRAGACAVVLAPLAATGTAFAAGTSADSLYRRPRFAPLVGASFRLMGATGSCRVRLTAVGDLPQAARGDNDCFTLTFHTAVAGPPQGTYTLRRPQFASTTLFLVPSDPSRRTYQAVINRGS